MGLGSNFKMSSFRGTIIAFAFVLYYCCTSEATTIVAIRAENGIFIGADSKAGGSPVKACKIFQSGNIFFAFSGHPTIKITLIEIPRKPVETKIFSIYEIVAEIAVAQAPINKKIEAFEATIRAVLPPIMESVRQNDLDHFCVEFFKGDKIILSAVIVGVVNNIPVLYGRQFKITTNCEEAVIIDVTSINLADHFVPGNVDVILYGEHKAILEKKSDSNFDIDKIAEYINEWITWEIVDRPNIVGPPIDIVHITSKGAEWVQHKPECPEIDQSFFNHSN